MCFVHPRFHTTALMWNLGLTTVYSIGVVLEWVVVWLLIVTCLLVASVVVQAKYSRIICPHLPPTLTAITIYIAVPRHQHHHHCPSSSCLHSPPASSSSSSSRQSCTILFGSDSVWNRIAYHTCSWLRRLLIDTAVASVFVSILPPFIHTC